MMMDQLIILHTNIVMNMMMECMNVKFMIMMTISLQCSMQVVIPNIMSGN